MGIIRKKKGGWLKRELGPEKGMAGGERGQSTDINLDKSY